MFFTIHMAPNFNISPTIASGVILNPNILHECIALMKEAMLIIHVHICCFFSEYWLTEQTNYDLILMS